MKIGITERGDAGLDLSWTNKLSNVDGAILITKNITPKFIDAVINTHKQGHKIIVHATCTGMGGTIMEPNVPKFQTQLTNLQTLILAGLPKENCVLRIDPIIPTAKGVGYVNQIFGYIERHLTDLLPIRVRISIYDEYKHVKEKLIKNHMEPVYGTSFYAPIPLMQPATSVLTDIAKRYNVTFETCAEPWLKDGCFEQCGCISHKDLAIMDITPNTTLNRNPQNRTGCMCLSCKTELLENRHRCPHQCLYCYWKD